MNLVEPSDLVGKRVSRVTVAWFESDGAWDVCPFHFWLHAEPDLGAVKFHTPGEGLQMTAEDPYESYDMGDSKLVVESLTGGHFLASLVGRRITCASTLVSASDDNDEVGVVLYLDSEHAVAIVNDVDELLVQQWPSATIKASGYVERSRSGTACRGGGRQDVGP